MVRLNKNKLPEKLLKKLFAQLEKVIGGLDKDQAGVFLYALLGKEERVMLAKRLAIVVMLNEGYSMYRVSRTLKVSPSTVEKVQSALARGVYDDLLPLLAKNPVNYKVIIDIIETLLSVGGVMPRYGRAKIPNG